MTKTEITKELKRELKIIAEWERSGERTPEEAQAARAEAKAAYDFRVGMYCGRRGR